MRKPRWSWVPGTAEARETTFSAICVRTSAGTDPSGASLCGLLKPPAHGNRPMDVVRVLLAIILPPLGVFMQVGLGLHFWLNILLTILGYVPGIIHAVWVVLRK